MGQLVRIMILMESKKIIMIRIKLINLLMKMMTKMKTMKKFKKYKIKKICKKSLD